MSDPERSTNGPVTAAETPAVTGPVRTSQSPEPGGGEHPKNTSASPRTPGFLPPLGWLGLVLFVVGMIVIGIAVGTSQGGNPDKISLGGGNLGPVSDLPLTETVGPNAIIGEVTVPETVPVYAHPQGTSIARANAGTYGLIDSAPGWAHIVLAGPGDNGLYVTGWAQISDGLTLTTN